MRRPHTESNQSNQGEASTSLNSDRFNPCPDDAISCTETTASWIDMEVESAHLPLLPRMENVRPEFSLHEYGVRMCACGPHEMNPRACACMQAFLLAIVWRSQKGHLISGEVTIISRVLFCSSATVWLTFDYLARDD